MVCLYVGAKASQAVGLAAGCGSVGICRRVPGTLYRKCKGGRAEGSDRVLPKVVPRAVSIFQLHVGLVLMEAYKESS